MVIAPSNPTMESVQDFPYALNALVPLASSSSSARLAQRCHEVVQRLLQTAAPGGDWGMVG